MFNIIETGDSRLIHYCNMDLTHEQFVAVTALIEENPQAVRLIIAEYLQNLIPEEPAQATA